MKTFAIVFALCVAGSLASIVGDEQKAKLRAIKLACTEETGVNPDVVEKAIKGDIDESDPKLACFTACILKKIGFTNADGLFDEVAFRAKIPPTIPTEKVDAIVNQCKHLTGANPCETGIKLFKCYFENRTIPLFN